MHPDDTNVGASSIIDKYEYEKQRGLHSLCLADFASRYVSKKASDMPVESDDIKNCSITVTSISDVDGIT